MKKYLIIALMCIASVTLFTACSKHGDVVKGSTVENIDPSTLDNTTERCWEITAAVGPHSETYYEWGTERFIVEVLQIAQQQIGSLGTYSYKANNAKTEEACLDQNVDDL